MGRNIKGKTLVHQPWVEADSEIWFSLERQPRFDSYSIENLYLEAMWNNGNIKLKPSILFFAYRNEVK